MRPRRDIARSSRQSGAAQAVRRGIVNIASRGAFRGEPNRRRQRLMAPREVIRLSVLADTPQAPVSRAQRKQGRHLCERPQPRKSSTECDDPRHMADRIRAAFDA